MFQVIRRTQRKVDPEPSVPWIVAQDLTTREEALFWAEVLASETAVMAGVTFKVDLHVGFELITNKGTQVWYSVKEI